jgi:hypothetical protein
MKSATSVMLAGVVLATGMAVGAPTGGAGPSTSLAKKAAAQTARGSDVGLTVASVPPDAQLGTMPAAVTTAAPTFSVDCTGDGALNVNDFICFQKAFVAGSAAANCDGSTAKPMLNVLDFMCFLNTFTAKQQSPSNLTSSTPSASGT